MCKFLVRRSPLLSDRLQRNSLKFRVGKKSGLLQNESANWTAKVILDNSVSGLFFFFAGSESRYLPLRHSELSFPRVLKAKYAQLRFLKRRSVL